ncbi:MAG TPA: diaminopimelate epimerase [Clostridiales bacterium]|nr:diaminopimelate epimerase [Clostridiales bacterium]
MKFTKMHGIGNDYVYVNAIKENIDDASELSKKLSNRNFGIGSDGLILIKSSQIADFYMDMYNADGSKGKMCGNGIRCVGKYVYDKGLTAKDKLQIETGSGVKDLMLHIENNKVWSVTVDMGHPITNPKDIPVISDKEEIIGMPIEVAGHKYNMTCVSLGNPHAVVFVDKTEDVDIRIIGPMFEHNNMFPDRVNTEFVQVIDKDTINMRVWERGSGETLACGTGACASVYACIRNGLTNNKVTVNLLGGQLIIEYDSQKDKIFMMGPAVTVFEGDVDLSQVI